MTTKRRAGDSPSKQEENKKKRAKGSRSNKSKKESKSEDKKSKKKSKSEDGGLRARLKKEKESRPYNVKFSNVLTYKEVHLLVTTHRALYNDKNIKLKPGCDLTIDDIKDPLMRDVLMRYDPQLHLYGRFNYLCCWYDITTKYTGITENTLSDDCHLSKTTFFRNISEYYGCLQIICENKDSNYGDENLRLHQFNTTVKREDCEQILLGQRPKPVACDKVVFPPQQDLKNEYVAAEIESITDHGKSYKLENITELPSSVWSTFMKSSDVILDPTIIFKDRSYATREIVSKVGYAGLQVLTNLHHFKSFPKEFLLWLRTYTDYMIDVSGGTNVMEGCPAETGYTPKLDNDDSNEDVSSSDEGSGSEDGDKVMESTKKGSERKEPTSRAKRDTPKVYGGSVSSNCGSKQPLSKPEQVDLINR